MKHFPLPQIIVFLVSLVAGRLMGIQYFADDSAVELNRVPRQSTHPVVYENTPVDQVNFLIIKVDSLQAEQPRLENLWWLLHKRQGSLNLVSLYPSLQEDANADALLQANFGISQETGGYQLDPSFVELLHAQELNWQGFLILDQVAFQELVGNQTLSTLERTAPLPYPEPARQLIQWRLFCRKNLQSSWQMPAQNPWVSTLDQQHLSFGPTPSLGLEIWQQIMSDTPTNTCSFPVLENKFNF